jgi:hypothetical protein
MATYPTHSDSSRPVSGSPAVEFLLLDVGASITFGVHTFFFRATDPLHRDVRGGYLVAGPLVVGIFLLATVVGAWRMRRQKLLGAVVAGAALAGLVLGPHTLLAASLITSG